MARETGIQVESYQRFIKWYLMPPCLTLSIIRYGSRVKWSNTRKGVVPFRTPRCRSYWKGSLRVILDYVRQLYLLNRFEIRIFLLRHTKIKEPYMLYYFTPCWRENSWIHAFPKGINAMWNTNNLVQDLKSVCLVHFHRR